MGKFRNAIAALSAVAFSLCLTPAHATEANRARALAEECKTDQNACEEYLLGVWDAVVMMQELTHTTGMVCPKVGPDGGELLRAFNKWVDENPDKMEQSRAVGAILAVKHAFPCDTASQ